MARHWTPCPEPGCPELRDPTTNDCPNGHTTAKARAGRARADTQRPPARQRGYDRAHETQFRRPVLARDPICVECGEAPSVHADHYPLTRRELIRRGRNPNDPRYGRGLCPSCHSRHTAQSDGGFGNPTR